MQAFGMRTIGYDPMLTKEQAASRNIELLTLDEIWAQADYITVHVPLIPQTANLLNAKVFAKCKKGVKIINVARGGIIHENDLVAAIDSGLVAGAALDVFEEEPVKNEKVFKHPKIICTPHLGASTIDAQLRVAVEVAENIVQFNLGNHVGILNLKQVLE